jgi:hypothetical protein
MAFSNTYNTTNTGSAVSNREQLLDVLTILAPEETPILSMAPKSKATSTFVEWTVDSLATPTTTGIREGADVTSFTDKFSGRARLGNYIQKFRRDFQVSDLQQAVDSVGPAKIAEAEAKSVREIKRDIEATICSNNDMTKENGTDTAYAMRGLGDWIDSADPGGLSPVPASYRTPAASIHATGDFTESDLNDIITSIYRVSGNTQNLTLVADTELRRTISNFARAEGTTSALVYNVNQDAEAKKITLSVSLYDSDHGMISIVNMNPDCAPDTTLKDTGYFINPSMLGVAELIPLGSTMLENQGGGERGYVDAALTLLVKHPGAFGKVTAVKA